MALFVIRTSHLLTGGGRLFFSLKVRHWICPPPLPTHTQSKKKKFWPLWQNISKPLTPHPPPLPPYTQTTLTYDNPILLSGPVEYLCTVLTNQNKVVYKYFLLSSTVLQMVTKFAGVQKCLTHWMKTKKKGKYDPWWFTVNISQYIIIFFYENDTNEVKGSYHDDC